MFQLKRSTAAAIGITTLAIALSGCYKPEGPAEKAGKAVDNAAEKVGQTIEKTGEKIQDEAKGNQK
ncbi:hypothetical protein RGU70_16195 [Herbaspirillum sp. RTI4]|uniref:hypothetical protein n=1 Tax=Herbaspirillum sp. RTI4 TaxID=3048640 RepID=UPI002AB35B7B|nr:hypothetical protein [Herbaspirillum sp. RTI4]MDY7579856.1 hypothetical protein [Herbaspirillum sp. RTI4]MEA9981943.1 hypothetical protein [Herbaspirillum sp. RTI4]